MNHYTYPSTSFFRTLSTILFIILIAGCGNKPAKTGTINREDLVKRHNVQVTSFDKMASLTVGNGGFAYTVDATGMQTFPELYSRGVSLGTQSDWGWHNFPNTENFVRQEAEKIYLVNGREVPFAVQSREKGRSKDAADYFRVNPHRLHLGIIGLEITLPDGTEATPESFSNLKQSLDMWEGKIHSTFTIANEKVTITTVCHPDRDLLSFKVESKLVANGTIKVKIRLPYPTGGHVDDAISWKNPEKHQSNLLKNEKVAKEIEHIIDSTRYLVSIFSEKEMELAQKEAHYYVLSPSGKSSSMVFSVNFSEKTTDQGIAFSATEKAASKAWKSFWLSGGAIDLSGSTNQQAKELERRIVLSQYLTRVQCAGYYPPQETGLTFNSWYGKPHIEMHWWHAVHYALWNRIELMEKSLSWYASIYDRAKFKAQKQGYTGVRWPKMTDLQGYDSPSSVGEFLIWQQPHFIYLAELCYQHHQDSTTLNKYADLVNETAEFMASFATYNQERGQYMLNPPLIPAQECLDRMTTFNPPFELAYWHWGLTTAQKWRTRMGLLPNEQWQKVIDGLPSLPHKNGLYLLAESAQESYENPKLQYDHPMPLGAFGMLPAYADFDTTIMSNTLRHILTNWDWSRTWGWDYPMVAMNATRLYDSETAISSLLMNVQKNTYLLNGHNYQDDRLRIYLPGNGGLLTATAMMCAGFDGCNTENPGFPKDGTWNVKWEKLNQIW